MNLAEKITTAELEVMRILWREGKPLSFTELRLELQEAKTWDKSTINTLIRRLVDKAVISAQKQGAIQYMPNISEREYRQFEEQRMLDRLYDGSAKNLVAAFCRSGKLSEADIDELKAYFKMDGDLK